MDLPRLEHGEMCYELDSRVALANDEGLDPRRERVIRELRCDGQDAFVHALL